MIATANTEPTFLYPKSRRFPFDEVCEQIVRALEERNWSVPGVTIDFDVYGTGAQKYRLVRYIRGNGFKLWFSRVQGSLEPSWNDTAAVTRLTIPGHELYVYDDGSGPTYYVYAGNDWEADKDEFMNGIKVNSKLNGKPRTYLEYSGSRLQSVLVHNNDSYREYEPRVNEPQAYMTKDVFARFTQWLTEHVLAPILVQPVPEEKVDIFRETATPLPAHLDPIFCFGDAKDARRVCQGKLDSSALPASDQYGLAGGGLRLVGLGDGDGNVPEIAYEGFLWCGFGAVSSETPMDTLTIPGHQRWSEKERYVFRVTPRSADDIYVADHAVLERTRKELDEAATLAGNSQRDFTRAEVQVFKSARGRTIVPIAEYDGSYEQPVVLVKYGRELGFDEVELVSGPWPEYQYLPLIMGQDEHTRQLFEQALSAQEVYQRSSYRDSKVAVKVAKAALQRLADHFGDDAELAAATDSYSRKVFRLFESNAQFIERLLIGAVEARSLGLI